jgi:murein DD-endopeptidase MepM/ murein hydrolase activator NlpD
MMGLIGTPVIAVESGTVEALGWNQYGGWRIGIRSFDGRRYYYYAHLRQNYPYAEGLEVGDVVTAGDVIGYMGHTGYSTTENVNNIEVTHLHWGLQLIFDESQKEGDNEIWIDVYPLTRFLAKHTQPVAKIEGTREWMRTTNIIDPSVK